MVYTGRHLYEPLCGDRRFYISKLTGDWKRVTCKNCRKRKKKAATEIILRTRPEAADRDAIIEECAKLFDGLYFGPFAHPTIRIRALKASKPQPLRPQEEK